MAMVWWRGEGDCGGGWEAGDLSLRGRGTTASFFSATGGVSGAAVGRAAEEAEQRAARSVSGVTTQRKILELVAGKRVVLH